MTDVAARKKAERERDKADGVEKVTIKLTKISAERLNRVCELRGYDRAELVALLMHRDWQLVEKIVEPLGVCEFCDSQLPQGCNGKFKGRGECFKTIKQRELLSL